MSARLMHAGPRLRERSPDYHAPGETPEGTPRDAPADRRAPNPIAPEAAAPELPAEATLSALWLLGRLPAAALPSSVAQRLLRPGRAGRGPGPDVREAALLLPSGVVRAGDVEVHVRASDWFRHGHHRDPAYDGVILHLVWTDDVAAAGGAEAAAGSVPLPGGGRAPTVALGPVLRGDVARLERLVARGPAGPAAPCIGARVRLGAEGLAEAVRLEGRRRLAERAWRAARLVDRYGWAGAAERLLDRALAATAGRRRESEATRAAYRAALASRLGADLVTGLLEALGEGAQPSPRALAAPFRLAGGPPEVPAIGEARSLELAWNVALPLLIAAAAAYDDVALARRTAALAAAWPAPRPYGRTAALAACLGPASPHASSRPPGAPAGGGALYAQGLLHLQDLWCARGGCGACPLS